MSTPKAEPIVSDRCEVCRARIERRCNAPRRCPDHLDQAALFDAAPLRRRAATRRAVLGTAHSPRTRRSSPQEP